MIFRKKGYLLLVPVLLGFLVSQAVSAGSDVPGSSTNPVISKSYADQVLKPLQEQIDSFAVEVARLKEIASRQDLPKFIDVPTTHWGYADIQFMVEKGIISGMGDGKFAPNNPARRSEVAVMLVKALNLPINDVTADFTDVPVNHWAYAHIAAAQKAGIISGFPGGEFKPNDNVTRAQMAAMLARAYAFERNGLNLDFKDVAKDYWAYEAIGTLADNGISRGFEDGTFRPATLVRRAEVAVLLAKAMDPARRQQ
ncbi:MAG: hypothetical protein CVU89_06170 [Firmicutes bacterium HGW-Firmicutes-14]|nr:MAG: hypothetical protein CVU89_06170 [Firmicutes bacterium HGW-Firmicutes-14]